MGITFNWFKGYEIVEEQDYYDILYFVSYVGWNSTEHSAGNVIRLQDTFEKITGKRIPTIDYYKSFDYREDAKTYIVSELISPHAMSEMCSKILSNAKTSRNIALRVQMIKDLSDNGYYVSYDAAG